MSQVDARLAAVAASSRPGRDAGISARVGIVISSGVPVLVLLSMGPVAGMAGPPSVLIWGLSAVIGFCMALAFAELAASRPYLTGGIGVLAASVYAPRSRVLALVSQWSYWFGWSPALAINGALVATYLHGLILPRAPSWTVVTLAAIVLGGSATVNHFGLRAGGRFQVILVGCVLAGVALFAVGAVLSGRFDAGRLAPFTPPGGWLSGHGVIALGGGLFIAGWSAYGAELSLSYSGEYREGTREAARALVIIAMVGILTYTTVPLILVGVVGTARLTADPSVALLPLARMAAQGAADIVVVILIVALALSLNMVTIGSSRALYRMARNGQAPESLGRLNRHGVPGNALRFDLAVNVTLLLGVTLIDQGHTASVPIALLAAANVGYFLSIGLALVAAWLNHRQARRGHRRLTIRTGLIHFTLALAGLNLVLIVFAGFAWGWGNLALGVLVLTAVITVFARRRRPAQVPRDTSPRPACIAWPGVHPAATTEQPGPYGESS
jgi:amino acid transporter